MSLGCIPSIANDTTETLFFAVPKIFKPSKPKLSYQKLNKEIEAFIKAFEEEIENKETELGGAELQENESVDEEEESSDIGIEVKPDIISEEKPHKKTVSSKKPFIRKILPWVGDGTGELIRKLLVIVFIRFLLLNKPSPTTFFSMRMFSKSENNP